MTNHEFDVVKSHRNTDKSPCRPIGKRVCYPAPTTLSHSTWLFTKANIKARVLIGIRNHFPDQFLLTDFPNAASIEIFIFELEGL
jgi:hypothetical protein